MSDQHEGHDPYRVDPADHQGEDIGILDRRFTLPRDRRDDDPRGPRQLPRDRVEGAGR